MSPEQARGLRSVDHRSDLWSVGVIAFRCMVGRLPFQGEAVGDVLVNLCTGPIPVPSELVSNLPPGFDGWTQRVLSRIPSERFSTAMELGEALAAVCGLTTPMAPFVGDARRSDPQIHQLGQRVTTPAPRDEQSVVPPLHPVSKSGSVSITHRSPSGFTGSGTANTPAPSPRQNTPTIIVATVLATLIIGLGVVALTRLGSGESEEPSVASPTPTAFPAPSEAPARAAAEPHPSGPAEPVAPTVKDAAPPAPSAAVSAAKRAPVGGPVGASTKGTGPSRASAPTRKKQSPASAPTQSLEIRLER
jgi:serine/threonine-protein kinase